MLHYLFNYYFLDLSPRYNIVIREMYLLPSLYGRGKGVGLYFLITVTSPLLASLMMLEGT